MRFSIFGLNININCIQPIISSAINSPRDLHSSTESTLPDQPRSSPTQLLRAVNRPLWPISASPVSDRGARAPLRKSREVTPSASGERAFHPPTCLHLNLQTIPPHPPPSSSSFSLSTPPIPQFTFHNGFPWSSSCPPPGPCGRTSLRCDRCPSPACSGQGGPPCHCSHHPRPWLEDH